MVSYIGGISNQNRTDGVQKKVHINIDAKKMAEMNELLGTPVKSQSSVSTGNQEQSTPRRSPRLRVASRSNYEDISPIKDVEDEDHVSSCTGRWDGTFIGSSSVPFPREGPGVKSRMCPPYPQRDRKRRLIGAVCPNHRIKRVVPCRCLDGHVKEPYEMSMALGARP